MAEMKGLGVLELVKLVKKVAREKGVENVAQFLGLTGSHVFADRVLTSTWYPYEEFAKLLRGSRRLIGGREPDYYEEMGRIKAETDLANTLSSFSHRSRNDFASFVRVMRHAWKAYNKPGEMQIKETGNGRARLSIEGAPHLVREHCVLTGGWICRAYELSGAKDVRYVHDRCVSMGDPNCEYQLFWAEE